MAWWITTSVSTIILTHRSAMRCSQESLQRALDEVCGRLELEYQLEWGTRPKRLCIFVSKYDHVLWEILLRHKAGELPCDIPLIISNHADLQPIADAFGVRFEVFKVTKATKPEVEAAEMKLMEELEIDLVVHACASIFWINPYAIDTTSTSPGVNRHAIDATSIATGPRPVHADHLRRVLRDLPVPRDQHPPLVPPGLHRLEAVS